MGVAMKEFFRGVLKIGVAIVGSIVVLSLIGGVIAWGVAAYNRHEAKPYQEVKRWESDLTDPLTLKMAGKTKLVDGRMYAEFTFDGYPPYLTYAANANSEHVGFSLKFIDKDGFEIATKNLPLGDALKIHTKGKIVGLRYTYDEYMPLETYERFENVRVGWNLSTEKADWENAPVVAPKEFGDPCEPKISKAERIKRLAKYGTVRQAGEDRYEVGSHGLAFFGNELLRCY